MSVYSLSHQIILTNPSCFTVVGNGVPYGSGEDRKCNGTVLPRKSFCFCESIYSSYWYPGLRSQSITDHTVRFQNYYGRLQSGNASRSTKTRYSGVCFSVQFVCQRIFKLCYLCLWSLRRGDDGRFRDNDIAVILQTATETLASAPRGRGIASCMQVMEIMVINQAREWNVCSLNDFRRYLGLKRLYHLLVTIIAFWRQGTTAFKKFEEWSSSPEIVTAAKDLYGEVDNLELYVCVNSALCHAV